MIGSFTRDAAAGPERHLLSKERDRTGEYVPDERAPAAKPLRAAPRIVTAAEKRPCAQEPA